MDNLARVIAIDLDPGQLIPCIRINKGVYTASLQAAQFQVEITLTYTSGRVMQPPVVSTQLVSGTEFVADVDSHTVRARGQAIGLRTQPDPKSSVVCATRIIINDATGTPVECWSADTNNFRV
jgi:hypothetical protein